MARHQVALAALCVFACTSCPAPTDYFQLIPSSTDVPVSSYPSFSEAIAAADAVPQATVCFPWGIRTYIEQVTIYTNVAICGHSSELVVKETLKIDAKGSLFVSNLTLTSIDRFGGVMSEGELALEGVVISGWKNSVITIASGNFTIVNCTVEKNPGLLLKLEKWSRVEVRGVVFRANSGGLLSSNSQNPGFPQLRIANSQFLSNFAVPVIQLSDPGHYSEMAISFRNCEFANNSAALFDLQSPGAVWELSECVFSNNSDAGVRVGGGNSSGLITNCQWRGNTGVVLALTDFQGELTLADSTISTQRTYSAITIANRDIPSRCKAKIVNWTIADSGTEDVSLLRIDQCEVELWNLTLSTITVKGFGAGNVIGVVTVSAGALLVANCEFRANLVSFGEVNALFSEVSMRNVSFISREHQATNSSLFFIGSQATLTDVHISRTSAVPVSFDTLVSARVAFIIIEVSQVHLASLRLSGPTYTSAVFGISYSAVTAGTVQVEGLRALLAFYLKGANVVVQDFTCQKCEFLHLLQGTGIAFRGVNIRLSESSVAIMMFLVVGHSSLEVEQLRMENVTIEVMATCESSTIHIRGLWAQNCSSVVLLSDIALSTVTVSGVRWSGATGALLTARSSVIAFFDVYIAEISTDHTVAVARGTAVSFDGVIIERVRCKSLSMFSQQTSATFQNVSVGELRATDAVLVQSRNTAIVIEYSVFANFNSCLISAYEGSVALRFSEFRSGGLDGTVAWEFKDVSGAVLQCVDCTTVEINNITVSDVWAVAGGVVHCEVEEYSTVVVVANSYFRACRGDRGGAISLLNVNATVLTSTFENCSANTQGGALFLSITRDYAISVTDSVFIGNTASEGGAIQWVDQPPSLTRLTFTNNSANYGPDIASYAVRISPKFEGPISPGQFITVSFTLQDHYQQLVTYESTQFLSLIDSDHLSIIGISSKPASGGIVTYQGVSFLATPNSTQILHARYSSSVTKASPAFESETQVAFRDCALGEIKSNVSCNPCSVGNYSQSLEDRECRLCPEGADCPGGEVVTPKAGAWATNSTQQPIAICRIPELCLGTSRNLCREGYRGRVCEECEDGWFALVQFGCWTCPSSEWLLLLEPFVSVAFLILCIMCQLRLGSRESERHYALHTLIYHMEFLSLLSFVRIDYPPPMQVYLHILLSLSTMSVASLPLQCYGVGYISHRLYGAGASFALLLLPVGVVTCKSIISRKWNAYRRELPLATVAVAWPIPYLNSVLLLPLFNCDDGVDGVPRLVGAMHQQCWDEFHSRAALLHALPILVISLIAPAAAILWKIRAESHQKPVLSDLRILVFGLFSLLWTLALCSSVLVQLISDSQVFLVLAALYSLAVLNGLSAGYFSKFLLFLSQSSLFTLIASYSLLVAYIEYRRAVFIYILMAANAVFVLACVRLAVTREASVRQVSAGGTPLPQALEAPNNSAEFLADAELVALEFDSSGADNSQ